MKEKRTIIQADAEKWDNRELGASQEHVGIVSDKTAAEIDDQLGLQAISIRLPKALIRDLKDIATRYEVGYQPMVRDLLSRFVQAEQKKYLLDELSKIEKAEENVENTEPVSEFLKGIRKKA